jgi:hypothetical protein
MAQGVGALPGADEGVDGDLLGIGMVADDEIRDGLDLAPVDGQQVVDDACAVCAEVSRKLPRQPSKPPCQSASHTNRRWHAPIWVNCPREAEVTALDRGRVDRVGPGRAQRIARK